MRCSRDSFLAGSFSKKFSGGRHMLQLQRQDIPDHRHCAPGCCIPGAAQRARIKPTWCADPSQSCCAVGNSGTTAEPDLITWTELEAAVAAVLLPPDCLPLLPCSLACGVGPELCFEPCDVMGQYTIRWATDTATGPFRRLARPTAVSLVRQAGSNPGIPGLGHLGRLA